MFNSLETTAEQRSRKRYAFLFAILFYVLFMPSAWVYSVQANTDTIEPVQTSEVLMPLVVFIEPSPTQPTPIPERPARGGGQQIPERAAPIDRISNPTKIPDAVSAKPSKNKELPPGNYRITDRDYDPPVVGNNQLSDKPSGGGQVQPHQVILKDLPEPPPVPTPTPKPKVLKRSGGVITGEAIKLPPPVYPAFAKTGRLQSKIRVAVVVNEYGKVVSAKAVSGMPVFFAVSEQAALNARFTPTYLSAQPVQTSGYIEYNFVLDK